MRRFLSLLFVLAVLIALPAHAEGLISDPGIDSGADWYRDMWYTDSGVSRFEIAEDGYEGSCLKITNVSENDARFCQDIPVKPDTLYEITCMVKAEGVGEDTIGANLSAKDTFSYSDYAYDTDGQWEKLTLIGRTGPDQDTLTLFARVGGYSGLNTGSAWFDNFTMREITAVPEGEIEWDLAPIVSAPAVEETETDAVPARYT